MLGFEHLAQGGQGAEVHDQIRIAHEDPLRRRRLPRQHGRAPVHAGSEADVVAGPHDADGRCGAVPREIRQSVRHASGGTVLHHHNGSRPVGEQGADAAVEQGPCVVVDHDGADLARHQVLSNPW